MNLFKRLPEVASDFQVWATSDRPRIGTGYSMLDGRTNGGAATGEVIFFVARPSVGKTAFALNVVANNPGVPTVFFSVEMHGRYIASRLAAITTRTPTWQIEATVKEYGGAAALEKTIETYPYLGVVDLPSINIDQMDKAMEEAKEAWGVPPALTIVDYLELVNVGMNPSVVEAVDSAAVRMKEFARRHDTVVLVLHQVSREQGQNGERPLGLRSGRYGGEQAADYFLAAFRPCLDPTLTHDEYERTQHQWYLQFLKNRAGGDIHPAGVMHYYDPTTMVITDTPLGQAQMADWSGHAG